MGQCTTKNKWKQGYKTKHNGTADHGSKSELDNVSGSSFESGLSRSSNEEQACSKNNLESIESFKEAENESEVKEELKNMNYYGTALTKKNVREKRTHQSYTQNYQYTPCC